MQQYLELGKRIIEEGTLRTGRGDAGFYSLFGEQLKFDLMQGFPIPTTQNVDINTVIAELIWMLSGDTNNNNLIKLGAKFWTAWALNEDVTKSVPRAGYNRACELALKLGIPTSEAIKKLNSLSMDEAEGLLQKHSVDNYESVVIKKAGDLGPVYGEMWRSFNGVDQIKELIFNLKSDPFSRRHIVSSWNPELLPDSSKSHKENIIDGKQVLPPCHTLWQVFVEPATPSQLIKYLSYNRHILQHLIDYGNENVNALIRRLSIIDLGRQDMTPGGITDYNNRLSAFLESVSFETDTPSGKKTIKLPTTRLSLKLYARSQDYPVGTVVNIPFYAALTHVLATTINAIPGDYIHSMGDVHIYANQIDQFKEQLQRQPTTLPRIKLPERLYTVYWDYFARELDEEKKFHAGTPTDDFVTSVFGALHPSEFSLINYNPHNRIKYKVLV